MDSSTLESKIRSDNLVTYESPFTLYSMSISSTTTTTSSQPSHRRIAVGSFIEEYSNRVDILSFDEETLSINPNPNLSFDHPKADEIIEEAELITEMVEEVAEKVDKVIEEIEENLPENSQIKKTLDYIELVAEKVRRLEGEGVPSHEAEAITSAIIDVLNDSLENVAHSFVSKDEMQRIEMTQDGNLGKFKSRVQSSQLLQHYKQK